MTYIPIQEFDEGTSGLYTATLLDEEGLPVPASDLVSIQLWLREIESGEIINDRNGQNVLGDGLSGVSFHDTNGGLSWQIRPADNAIAGTSGVETHEMIWRIIWDEGNKAKVHRRYIKVKNVVPIV